MDWIVPFVTLTAMEIVLGIDNIVFIAILVGRLPASQQARARSLGLIGALVMRILLLLSISWVMKLTDPIFHLSDLGIPASWVTPETSESTMSGIPASGVTTQAVESGPGHAVIPHSEINGISWKDLILLAGGAFLIWHSVKEIHDKVEGKTSARASNQEPADFNSVLAKIIMFDIIFSLDSVITAVGMAKHIPVMIAAVAAAMVVMLIFAGRVSDFVDRHPTIKILALSFLILIGVLLLAEGLGTHMNKGYIYFAMAFSLAVEFVNMRIRPVSPSVASDD